MSARPGIHIQHGEPIFRAGLSASLSRLAGFELLDDGAAASILVCDYPSSVRLTQRPGVVVIARRPRDYEIQDAMARGVLAYVSAGCSLGELEQAVRAAALGRRFLCQAAACALADGFTAEPLTAREREVLGRLALGECNKTIARELGIAVHTVKTHVRGILAKLGASSRTEAATLALARGLLGEAAAA